MWIGFVAQVALRDFAFSVFDKLWTRSNPGFIMNKSTAATLYISRYNEASCAYWLTVSTIAIMLIEGTMYYFFIC